MGRTTGLLEWGCAGNCSTRGTIFLALTARLGYEEKNEQTQAEDRLRAGPTDGWREGSPSPNEGQIRGSGIESRPGRPTCGEADRDPVRLPPGQSSSKVIGIF